HAVGGRACARRHLLCQIRPARPRGNRHIRPSGAAGAVADRAADLFLADGVALVGDPRRAGRGRRHPRLLPAEIAGSGVLRPAAHPGLLGADPRPDPFQGRRAMSLPLDLLMFAALIAFILLGYPVAFTISGVATAFALIGWMTGDFSLGLMGALGQRFFAVLTNPVLTAIPLFVLMGVVLEKSRIAEDLLETMGRLFGPMRGGL